MSDEFTDKYTDIKPELVFQPFEDKVDDIKTKEEKRSNNHEEQNHIRRHHHRWCIVGSRTTVPVQSMPDHREGYEMLLQLQGTDCSRHHRSSPWCSAADGKRERRASQPGNRSSSWMRDCNPHPNHLDRRLHETGDDL